MQQRQHPRFSVHLPLVIGTTGPGTARHAVRTKDISLGGACLHADSDFPVGTALTLYVPWLGPDGQPTAHTEAVTGRVVWMTRIEQEYQLGVVFDAHPAAASRRCLEELCGTLERSTPGLAPLPKQTFDLS
ncbi:MAG: PilZ domain-containing protein [Myxococcales bacterium]|nr:PilZ domain-containing protein [Myxococcales bacterium]